MHTSLPWQVPLEVCTPEEMPTVDFSRAEKKGIEGCNNQGQPTELPLRQENHQFTFNSLRSTPSQPPCDFHCPPHELLASTLVALKSPFNPADRGTSLSLSQIWSLLYSDQTLLWLPTPSQSPCNDPPELPYPCPLPSPL